MTTLALALLPTSSIAQQKSSAGSGWNLLKNRGCFSRGPGRV
jgi:hypothetical protein